MLDKSSSVLRKAILCAYYLLTVDPCDSVTVAVIKEIVQSLTKIFSFFSRWYKLTVIRRMRFKLISIGSWFTKVAEFLRVSNQSQHVPTLKIHFELVGGDAETPPSTGKKDSSMYITHSNSVHWLFHRVRILQEAGNEGTIWRVFREEIFDKWIQWDTPLQ